MIRARPTFQPVSAGLSAAICGTILTAFVLIGAGQEVARTASPALTLLALGAEHGEDTSDPPEPSAAQVSKPAESAKPPTPAPAEQPRPLVQSLLGTPAAAAAPAPAVPSAPAVPASAAPTAPAMAKPAPANPAPPAQPAAAPARAARAGASNGDVRGKSRAYAARVRAWLLSHKTYPKGARMRRQEGIVQVRFVLDRDGRLVEGRLIRSSGFDLLDREGLEMLSRAVPYPKAPDEIAGERIEFSAPIEFLLRS